MLGWYGLDTVGDDNGQMELSSRSSEHDRVDFAESSVDIKGCFVGVEKTGFVGDI